MTALPEGVAGADWQRIERELNETGHSVIRRALDVSKCEQLRGVYDQSGLFRSRIVMARYGFGQGEYQYFDYPLPALILYTREALYQRLAPVANAWGVALGRASAYPATLGEFLEDCHRQGQTRPTPLLLNYGTGDYNRLHQDLYGGVQFPLQATVLLSAAGDFDGGEFVLTETAPRKQTRAEVVKLAQGDMVIFAVNHRPVRSTKGFARVTMRHGVSTVRRGARMTLGLIFHDAA